MGKGRGVKEKRAKEIRGGMRRRQGKSSIRNGQKRLMH